ncbi:DUF1045 domain-containing protein [Crenobacter sp. SG2303]|uniref:DUF1045 domain-containing protein n=1 Tax=Crenobacter oryzisoli TaxID=3056844 RepID=A0ABT7XN75_9NEIS|nr:DUF1045 domain-containing protein [Crenobacter sp. SG2303]MDN0075259.1 DUF1045 domain-containing protein [Crenobacter sp. SG2303]
MRYALYYAPRPGSDLAERGAAWLGRDAVSGQAVARPIMDSLSAERFSQLTAAPACYGWHATLKAPFAPVPEIGEAELIATTQALAQRFAPFTVPLRIETLAGFLALRPADGTASLAELAAACMVGLAPLAQLPDAAAQARRAASLTARERALLARWGYPYVFEYYRFHLTLSDRLADPAEAERLATLAETHFAGGALTAEIDAIALFVEPAPGAPFHCVAHIGFDGEVQRHDH